MPIDKNGNRIINKSLYPDALLKSKQTRYVKKSSGDILDITEKLEKSKKLCSDMADKLPDMRTRGKNNIKTLMTKFEENGCDELIEPDYTNMTPAEKNRARAVFNMKRKRYEEQIVNVNNFADCQKTHILTESYSDDKHGILRGRVQQVHGTAVDTFLATANLKEHNLKKKLEPEYYKIVKKVRPVKSSKIDLVAHDGNTIEIEKQVEEVNAHTLEKTMSEWEEE